MTMGELMALQVRPVDSARANRPVDCPVCRANSHRLIPAHAVCPPLANFARI